jgi:hypothetical protein
MHSERRSTLIGNPHRIARFAGAFGPRILWALGLGACLAFGAETAAARPVKAPPEARAEPASPGPQSQYIAISIDGTNGQFTMGVPNGGPILLYGYPGPWSSFTSFRVDGTDITNNYSQFGTMIQPPANTSSTTNEGIWQLGTGNLRVHQILTLVSGPASGRPDTYLIQYKVDNLDSVSHTVGCRVMLDTDLDDNDGAPFRVPGVGSVTTERQFDGVDVPSYFFVFNDLNQPGVAAQGTLLDPQVTLSPDRVQIVSWQGIYDTDFEYAVDSNTAITRDSAYAVYWLNQTIPAGRSAVFSTLYGLGNIQVDSADPLITAETAPASLACINHQYAPSPFDISLTLSNTAAGAPDPVTGITVTLDLPPGLELSSGSATVNLPDMPVNDVQFASWKVAADGNLTGSLDYSIDLATSNFGSKTLNYAVQVPPGCLCPRVSLVSVDPTACPSTTARVSVAEHGGLQEDGQDVAITSVAPVGGLPGTYQLAWTTLHGDGMQHSLSVSATFNDCTVSAAGTVQCTCSGLSCDASAPASAQAHSAAAFTASGTITGCTAPLSYLWSFGDGGASAQQNPSHTYNAGGSYNWSVVVSGGGLSCTRSGTLAVAVDPPVITSMMKVAPPFTIAVNGGNLQNGIRVYINGTEWTQVLYKKATKIKLTGGKSLKAVVPKGVPALFHFVNPDGGTADMTWSW